MTVAIGIVGCAGRMGRTVIQEVMDNDGCRHPGGTAASGRPIGTVLGA